MNIQILNRYTKDVIFEHDMEDNSIGDVVEIAVKRGIDLSYADLSEAMLFGRDLRDGKFREAEFLGANFYHSRLDGANLFRTNMSLATMSHTTLKRTNFEFANLTSTNFEFADLSLANLCYAHCKNTNFTKTNLFGANLEYAYLRDCIGNGDEIRTMQIGTYHIVYAQGYIWIGCRRYTKERWITFTDEEISKMDIGALDWWNTWKDIVLLTAEKFN